MQYEFLETPDFDFMMKLAEESPAVLDQLQAALNDALVNSSEQGNRENLKRLRFRLEMEKRRAKNPYDSMIRVSRMMHDKLNYLHEVLSSISQQGNETGTTESTTGNGEKGLISNVYSFDFKAASKNLEVADKA